MTKKELSQLFYLSREIERLEVHRQQLQQQIDGLRKTSDTVRGSGLAHPFVLHSITIGGIDGRDTQKALQLRAELVDVKHLIELKSEQCTYEYSRLMRYINSVEDSATRQILTLRFVDGLPWGQVAQSIGGGNTENGVKQAAHRFLKGK